jgi:hypothetical protein
MSRSHDCVRHAEKRVMRAYSHLVVHPTKRRWWHRFLPPKMLLNVCGKCGKPLPSLDARFYA